MPQLGAISEASNQCDMYAQAWLLAGNETYGVREAVRQLVRGLRNRGVTCSALCLSEGEFFAEAGDIFDSVTYLGIPRRGQPVGPLISKVLATTRSLLWLRRDALVVRSAMSATAAGVLNVVWPDLLPLAATAAGEANVTLAWHVMNVVGSYRFDLNRRLFAHFLKHGRAKIFASSTIIQRQLGELLPSQLLPLAADERRFQPTKTADDRGRLLVQLGLRPELATIGLVARLDFSKGQDLLIDAIAVVPETLQALIVGGPGDARYADKLAMQIVSKGLESRVRLTGPTPNPERFYPAIDLAVHLMRNVEPFGLSVVEAMLCGKPVLAADQGGPSEIIGATDVGWLIKQPLTASRVAAALDSALVAQSRWNEMGSIGRTLALERYSASAVARTYLAQLSNTSDADPPLHIDS